jgi:hypothetical protein
MHDWNGADHIQEDEDFFRVPFFYFLFGERGLIVIISVTA